LAFAFGPRVAEAVGRAAIGDVVRLNGSRGVDESLVIIERFAPGTAPPFDSIRHQVSFDWRAEHDEARLKQRVGELRDQFVVRVIPDE
jgi:hypothetical protein